jgi:hypothetical protein
MLDNVTDLSRPKIVNHLLKGAVFGGMAYAAYRFAFQFGSPWGYGLGLIAWVCAAAVLRNLHALLVLPKFVLSPDGIRLRYWRFTDLLSLGLFRPWNPVFDLTVPWSLYEGCGTFKRSGGDPWDAWQALRVETTYGTLTIGWDVFARNVDDLMAAVAEYRESQFRQPLREAARVNDFQRRRFQAPLRLEESVVKEGWLEYGCGAFMALLLLGVFGMLGTLGLIEANRAGILDWVLLIAGGVIATIVLLVIVLRDRTPRIGTRILELRTEGVALGNTEATLQVFPWEDVLYTRMIEQTHQPNSDNPFKSMQLLLHLRNRRPVELGARQGYTLQELSDLLDPPLDKVREAWNRVNVGEAIETAAVNAGLPLAFPRPALARQS